MDYETDFSDNYLETKYGKIFYKYHKGTEKSSPIIFIHGLGADTRSWLRTVDNLEDNLNIYLIDLLGHGKSDAPNIEYKVDVQVSILKEFIEKLNINPIIVGHSYGGWVTALYASLYDTQAIVLEDSAGFYNEDYSKNTYGEKEILYKKVMQLAGNHDYVIKSIINSDNTEFYLNKEILSKIKTPTLIVWGRDDETVSIDIGRKLNEYIIGSKLTIIENAGHVSHYSQSEIFSKTLTEFLQFLKGKQKSKQC